jgi:hypothetical protein
MNQFIKQVIEETFTSKKQQRYFFSKANDKSLSKKERQKWSKMAKEFSDKTNYKKIPEVAEEEVDEIVDADGNIARSNKPGNIATKGVTSRKTTDQVAPASTGMMGAYGILGGTQGFRGIKYWSESDMSKSLGYQDTLGQDEDYEEAKDHFEDELGIDDTETKERLGNMGYDEELPPGKVRLIENPKKFIEEYIESILAKRTNSEDVLEKDGETEKEPNPIIKKQIEVLKQTLKDNGISKNVLLKYLNDNE